MVTQESDRRSKLEAYGVPEGFLLAIDNAKSNKELEFLLVYPRGFYINLVDIADDYSILKGFEVTPIYECCNGDSYWVLLSKGEDYKFIHFELEQDEIYDDYGKNFNLMLADFIITYYESAVDLPVSDIVDNAKQMGFSKPKAFLEALKDADSKGLRRTFESDKAWRDKNIPLFI